MSNKVIGKSIVIASLMIGFLGYFPHTYTTLSNSTNSEKPIVFSQQVLAVGETVGSVSIFLLLIGLYIFFREEK